jgi:SMC interacting uncharacterized protein involved in chromosome segregation
VLAQFPDVRTESSQQTCVTELKTLFQQLHDDLALAERNQNLQEQLEAAEQRRLEYGEECIMNCEEGIQEEMTELEADRNFLDQQLIDKTKAYQVLKTEMKTKDKQINTLTASEKKLRAWVSRGSNIGARACL